MNEYTEIDVVNLPISEHTKDMLVKFNNGEIDNVPFKVLDNAFNKAVFILVHGNEDGYICMNDKLIDTEELLDSCIRLGLNSDEVDSIYTISCYGGLQGTYTKDGITIKSVHDEVEEIYYRLKASKDDKYWMTLYMKKWDYENDDL